MGVAMKRAVPALLALLLVIPGLAVAAQSSVSIGIQIGPPPPRVVYVVPPPPPQPEYVWVEGYWYPVKHKYKWHDGYWTRPPYAGARWIAARYDGKMFFEGYWTGDRGWVAHDHRWDGDRDRDDRENDQGNGRHRGREDRD
jgi:hypothetical protein